MTWKPNATVAVVVQHDDHFLMVEERSNGRVVLNQPAGHIERSESVFEAARREALEETGYDVELTGFLGLYILRSAANGLTYHRCCFIGEARRHVTDALDDDILAAHWLTWQDLMEQKDKLRSPLVLQCIEDFRNGRNLPLDVVREL